MEIHGKIIAVLAAIEGTSKAGNPYKAQDFVIEEDKGEYPQSMCFQVFGQKLLEQANLKIGDLVTVHFNVKSRPYGQKWYNTISAWRIVKDTNPYAYNPNPEVKAPVAKPEPTPTATDDNLPF